MMLFKRVMRMCTFISKYLTLCMHRLIRSWFVVKEQAFSKHFLFAVSVTGFAIYPYPCLIAIA